MRIGKIANPAARQSAIVAIIPHHWEMSVNLKVCDTSNIENKTRHGAERSCEQHT